MRAPTGLSRADVIGAERRAASARCSAICSANDFPSWTASLNISYPLGTSQQEANLARARLQQTQRRRSPLKNRSCR